MGSLTYEVPVFEHDPKCNWCVILKQWQDNDILDLKYQGDGKLCPPHQAWARNAKNFGKREEDRGKLFGLGGIEPVVKKEAT